MKHGAKIRKNSRTVTAREAYRIDMMKKKQCHRLTRRPTTMPTPGVTLSIPGCQ